MFRVFGFGAFLLDYPPECRLRPTLLHLFWPDLKLSDLLPHESCARVLYSSVSSCGGIVRSCRDGQDRDPDGGTTEMLRSILGLPLDTWRRCSFCSAQPFREEAVPCIN